MASAIVHAEILLRPESVVDTKAITEAVESHIKDDNGYSLQTSFRNRLLKDNVECISFSMEDDSESFKETDLELNYMYHVYKLYDLEAADEILENHGDPDLPAASHLILPSVSLQGLWESLTFDPGVKSNLLKYVKTIIRFADKNVDSNIISCNRVVLLHGPPGTGKTSLCRALAQKVAIQLSHRYQQGSLLEINSHSLFSKWFSESGNLVRKMFAKIEELVSDPDNFVCVLIDEVESLTCARASHDSGTEPSDAIRVVNALLTQIDRIKRYPNVVILTTSNVTGKLDAAFVDRADIKQYIGNPCVAAIYEILRSCILELMRVDVITSRIHLPNYVIQLTDNMHYPKWLKQISEKCTGLSGRALRKLPFITDASFLSTESYTIDVFLDGLSKAIDQKFEELKALSNS